MRVLVTGGNRYIGLHLLFELAAAGHEVTVVNSHLAAMPPGCRRIHADRRDPAVLYEALLPHRDEFDVVFDNTAYEIADLEPMIELFHGRVQQFVFTSSVAVYRRSLVQPVAEDAARHDPASDDPRKAYGVNKVRCEDLLSARWHDTGFPATSLRVSHTFGPLSPLASREPIMFKRLEEGRPILLPGRGMASVHLVHVEDVARLMSAVCGNPAAIGKAYNVAGSETASIEAYVLLMARIVGVEPKIIHVPVDVARTARPPLLHWGEAFAGSATFSTRRAERELGFHPKYGIVDGMAHSYEWFKTEGRERYQYDFSGDEAVLAALAARP
jgi:nucleoside-diphosphate-sugar epimerase